MAAYAKETLIPLETYFEREDVAETKSEYYDGKIVAMAGATLAHVTITSDLPVALSAQLKGNPCQGFNSDLRIYVEACNTVFYPDLTFVCDTPRFAATRMATLLNPTLLIEVLSPSTERADRGIKFDCYRTLESLSTYVLISQEEPRIERFTRQADGSWLYEVVKGTEGVLALPAIGCELRLADVYARVEFPAAPPAEV